MKFVSRTAAFNRLSAALSACTVVGLVGPRQCGKNWLAKRYVRQFHPNLPPSNFFDLENLRDLVRLENPFLPLEPLSGLVILDEVQHKPELFQT